MAKSKTDSERTPSTGTVVKVSLAVSLVIGILTVLVSAASIGREAGRMEQKVVTLEKAEDRAREWRTSTTKTLTEIQKGLAEVSTGLRSLKEYWDD